MKRRSLAVVTVGSLFFSGLVLDWTGWLVHRPQPVHRAGEARAQAMDPMSSDAGIRYRHCQPTHWRAVMLQH